MRSYDALPAWQIGPGEVGHGFLARGLADVRSAAAFLRTLPYGRNTDRSNDRLVLVEQRRTCSTKHALLARLALEQGYPVTLWLGIYAMTEANTPGVGAIPASHGLGMLPEAHCYLRFGEHRIDITRDQPAAEAIDSFMFEELIQPDQIGEYKVRLHQRFLCGWANSIGRAFDEAWAIREDCITAMSDTGWNPILGSGV